MKSAEEIAEGIVDEWARYNAAIGRREVKDDQPGIALQVWIAAALTAERARAERLREALEKIADPNEEAMSYMIGGTDAWRIATAALKEDGG